MGFGGYAGIQPNLDNGECWKSIGGCFVLCLRRPAWPLPHSMLSSVLFIALNLLTFLQTPLGLSPGRPFSSSPSQQKTFPNHTMACCGWVPQTMYPGVEGLALRELVNRFEARAPCQRKNYDRAEGVQDDLRTYIQLRHIHTDSLFWIGMMMLHPQRQRPATAGTHGLR